MNEDVFNLQDILMVAIERLQCPLHVGDFCPPGHPPSQIIGKCCKTFPPSQIIGKSGKKQFLQVLQNVLRVTWSLACLEAVGRN